MGRERARPTCVGPGISGSTRAKAIRNEESERTMAVRSHQADHVVEEVGVWLAGEVVGRLPAAKIARFVKVTRLDRESSIAPEELGEMLHRLGRARLQRIAQLAPAAKVRIPQAR